MVPACTREDAATNITPHDHTIVHHDDLDIASPLERFWGALARAVEPQRRAVTQPPTHTRLWRARTRHAAFGALA